MERSQITYINNQLCVPAFWLYSDYSITTDKKVIPMPAMMTYKSYGMSVYRGKIHTVGHPGPGKPAMVLYERLDENYKMLIEAAIGGNPYKVAKRNLIEREILRDENAADFFYKHQFEDGKYIKDTKQAEYTLQAEIFNAFTHIIKNKKSMQYKHVGRTKGEMWDTFTEALGELDTDKYPHKLPANPVRLRDKYEKYAESGYESLIHAGHGNNSASATKEEEQEAIANRLLSDHRNLDNVQVASLYNLVAEPLGWKKITSGTVANMRKRTETLTDGGRLGQTAFRNKHTMQFKRTAPKFALTYWTLDGWDVELLYQKTEIDKKGYSNTTYHNRLTVVVVLDAAAKYPIGYAIGTHENTDLITAALRNAAQHTAELFGTMYKPNQIQSDNYGRGALTPIYEAMSEKYTPARVKNAKAKIVEPYFKYLNKTYCQLLPNWSGFGITSRKDKQPNSELLNKIKKSFPDEAECRGQITAIMETEREKQYQKYKTAYEIMPAENRLELSYDNYLYSFGKFNTRGDKKLTNRMEPDGLLITINGEKRCYDSFERKFRMLYRTDWTILYDENNLDRVLAVNEDGTRRFLLEDKYIQPMALADRQDGDAEQRKRTDDFNNELESEVIDFNEKNYELTRHVLGDKRLEGTLTKLVLTDSHGQHKDRKNELRAKTEKLNAKAEKKELKAAVKGFREEQDEWIDNKLDTSKYF